jgi:hypothetical protein
MIVDIPTVKSPFSSDFSLTPLSSMVENDFNPGVEITELDDFWQGELKYRNLDPAQAKAFFNWMAKMRGPVNEFMYVDHKHEQLGNWSGTPLVKGDNQDGRELGVDGLAASQFIAPEGDRFQLGNYLYHLTEDVVADGNGEAVLQFVPELRVIPVNNQSLIVDNPACKCFILPKQKPPQTRGKKRLTNWEFKFRESIR